jgi:deoxyadenosine/deoxycytidine kinase
MARIIVEGTVGVGKSSVLTVLGETQPGWFIFPEPVEQWHSYAPRPGMRINFLNDFYAAPSERSFRLLQTQIINTLLMRYTLAADNPGVVNVFERSIRVAREVFMETYHDWWSVPETLQLRDLASWASDHFERDVHTVYLRCTPEAMLERVLERRRASESTLT